MNGTKADHNKGGVVDGSRFVFEDPAHNTPHRQTEMMAQPPASARPAPDAFMPRPSRPFPISSRDENPKRGNWWNKIEFIFACIAVSVNFGCIWTLPYLVYRNGGGLFFILFVVGMFVIFFPYLVLEMALGQFSSSGIVSLWNFSPLFKGMGVVTALFLALHNVLITIFSSYHLLYAFFTIKYSIESGVLPWLSCSNAWNTASCRDGTGQTTPAVNVSVGSNTFDSMGSYAQDRPLEYPITTDPGIEYFHALVGNLENADLTDIGTLKPTMVFGLLATWGFILALTCMGVKWTGKVAYFVIPVLVILLFALLIRGATLPGALNGLVYFLFFDANSLLQYQTWIDAFGAVYYGSFMGLGIISALSSYNKFHNNFCLDAFFIVIAVIVINFMGVLLVATYSGFYAFHKGIAIEEVIGVGLTSSLVSLPTMLSSVPSGSAWTCVFFLTVFLLLASSSIYMVQALLTTLLDIFHLPHSFIFLLPTSGIICVLSFLVSLPMVTEAGFSLVVGLDNFTLSWAPLVVVIILPLVSVWVYGTIPKWEIMRLPKEIQKMVGFFPQPIQFIFLVLWAGVIPFCTLIFLLYKLVEGIQFHAYINPYWMRYVLLAVGILPLVFIPIIVGLYQLCKQRRGYTYFTQIFWYAAKSSPDWGPPLDDHRRQVRYACAADASSPQQLNSEIHFNPATAPHIMPQDAPAGVGPPPSRQYSPPPPAYNGFHQPGRSSPASSKNLSPAPSSAGSGLPTVYPSPLAVAGQQPPASPATVSVTDTVDSGRLYPSGTLEYATGAETDLGLSEQEDSPFVNMSSHETTL